MRDTTDRLETIALYDLNSRVARFFLATLKQIHGNELPESANLRLTLSQSDIAGILGASRPKVNRAILSLEECSARSSGSTGSSPAISAACRRSRNRKRNRALKSVRRRRVRPLFAGALASLIGALFLFFLAGAVLEIQREQFFDTLTQWVPAPQSTGDRRRRR